MCLIAVGPLPKQDICEHAAEDNPHGIGLAWLTKRGVEFEKGLSVKALLDMPKWIRDNCAVHFRLSTAGSLIDGLNHPFPIEKEVGLRTVGRAKAVLMHNGHVSGWEDKIADFGHPDIKKGDKEWSDSRWLAYLAWKFGTHEIFHMVSGQRILYFSPSEVKLYGTGWEKDGDIWYSNTTYKYRRVVTTGYTGSNYQGRGSSSYTDKHGKKYEWESEGGYWANGTFHEYEYMKRERDRKLLTATPADKEEAGKASPTAERLFLPEKAESTKSFASWKRSRGIIRGSVKEGRLESDNFFWQKNDKTGIWSKFSKPQEGEVKKVAASEPSKEGAVVPFSITGCSFKEQATRIADQAAALQDAEKVGLTDPDDTADILIQ